MERLAKVLGKRWVKITLLIFGAIFILLLFYFLSFSTNIWLYYPNPFKAQTAYSRLQMSAYKYQDEALCHEDCAWERQVYKKILADYAFSHPEMEDQIKKAIFDPLEVESFRVELVRVIAAVEKRRQDTDRPQIPDDLLNYLEKNNPSYFVVQEIFSQFGKIESSKLIEILKQTASNKNIEIKKRAQALAVMSGSENKVFAPFLLDFVKNKNNNLKLRYAAINALMFC